MSWLMYNLVKNLRLGLNYSLIVIGLEHIPLMETASLGVEG